MFEETIFVFCRKSHRMANSGGVTFQHDKPKQFRLANSPDSPGSPTNIPNRQRPHEHPDQALDSKHQETQASHSMVDDMWLSDDWMTSLERLGYIILQFVAIPQNSLANQRNKNRAKTSCLKRLLSSQPSLVDDVVSRFNTSSETELCVEEVISCQSTNSATLRKGMDYPSSIPLVYAFVFWDFLNLCIQRQRYIMYIIYTLCQYVYIYI